MIYLYLKTTKEFVRLIFQDRFLVVHTICSNGQISVPLKFPVDHFVYPVVSCLILFLCYFAAFAYYVIDCFVSITT